MTLSDINSRITFFTNADTTQYSNANRLIGINAWYNKIHTMILQSQDEWDFDDSNKTDFPIATANLVANQQDYALPSNILKIKRVEVTYDGTTWYKAEPFDVAQRTEDTNDISDFSTSKPYYDIQGNSLFLYPKPSANVTNGLKVWIDRDVTEFSSSDLTTGTLSPGFDNQFHEMIPIGASYDWAVAKGKENANQLLQLLQDYEARLRTHYGSKQKDRQFVLGAAHVDYE